MGNKIMEEGRDGLQESYQVVAYPAAQLPQNFQNMVRSQWKRTARHSNDYFKLWDADSYFQAYERLINHVFARPKAVARIAVLPDAPDTALGWSVIEGSTLHFVFVQYEQRNQGIAKMLVPVQISAFTHITTTGLKLWPKLLPNAIFDPVR
jgi:hypothetical protein